VDLELSANLKTALSAWVAEAVQHIKDRSELAELKKCMDGDGDVRIVFSARRNAIVIETLNFAEQTATEIFREELVPWLGGFALPGAE
jgi:hypothetical protein